MIEQLAECDDAIMELYVDGRTADVSEAMLRQALRRYTLLLVVILCVRIEGMYICACLRVDDGMVAHGKR